MTTLGVSVVVITWRRPDHVRACLAALAMQQPSPVDTIVVDASEDDATADVVHASPGATYVRFPPGARRMTRSRNEGLRHCGGEIVAFLDDDAYPREGWLAALTRAFSRRPDAWAAVGRTCNGLPGEELAEPETIGKILADGTLTGNFAALVDGPIVVEHGIGANMAFRRNVLEELGGFRDDMLGVGGVREDADMFLRTRAHGGTVVFVPDAVVDHVGAAHAHGGRFDWRYAHYTYRNHTLLLARNLGMGSPVFLRHLRTAPHRIAGETARTPLRTLARIVFATAGLIRGIAISTVKARLGPSDPHRRRDIEGQGETSAADGDRSEVS
jgi:GT2 family glycosyltransferase